MPQPKINKILLGLTPLAIIGFTDASFVALKSLQGQIVPCSILKGCDIVLQSGYSRLFGVPVALIGAVYYVTVLLLIAVFLLGRRRYIMNYIAILTAVGSIMSLWFIYLQVFVIKAVCLYCLVSATTSFALFALSLMAVKTIRRTLKNE